LKTSKIATPATTMADIASQTGHGQTAKASVYFFKPEEKFNHEKPYGFHVVPRTTNIAQTNIECEKIHGVSVTDMRGHEKDFSLERNGFAHLDVNTDLTYEDYHDSVKVQIYFRQMEAILKDHLKADQVKVFRYGIRKRDPTYPAATGKAYEFEQPTTRVHIDATLEEARGEVQRQEGSEAPELIKKRFQWINFWKPLRGPLNDWPIMLCDASTVDKDRDITAADLIYSDHAAENMQVRYRPEYKWYFLSSQTTSEVLVFKQTDSAPDAGPGVPHCSFNSSLAREDESPRESIEVRALVYYK